jgi:hypothetical protein
MNAIRRYLRLSHAERAVLPRVAGLVAFIRLSLWVLPFAKVQHLLRRPMMAALFPNALAGWPVSRLAWAVETTSRRIPSATCLTQSLALQFLLMRAGQSSALRIGVARSVARGFQAHAWVEWNGQTLIDRPEDVAFYTPLASWESSV